MNPVQRLYQRLKKNSDGMPKLWTYDFTVLILGSLVSLAGGYEISHVLNLFVYDITNNNPLVGTLTLAINYAAGVIIPFVAAGFVAKYQKRKLIYTLDFLNAGILFVMFFVCRLHIMELPTVFFYLVVFGIINNIYTLAFKSYMPKLVSGQNYSKAFSISSVIQTFSEVSVVIGTIVYSSLKSYYRECDTAVGIIFLFAGILFLIAAIFEARMKYDDVTPEDALNVRQQSGFRDTAKQVFSYIKGEKALFLLLIIGFATRFADGALYGIIIPFFRTRVRAFHIFGFIIRDKDLLYSIVMGFYSAGFFWGGLVNYNIKMKPQRKAFLYLLAFFVEKGLCILMALMQEPIPMMPLMFIAGFAGMIVYSMQNVAVYSSIPRELTERFTGVYEAIQSLGYIAGLLGAGIIASLFRSRNIHFTYVILFGVAILLTAGVALARFPQIKELFAKEKDE